jgi:hypothetical protein
LTQQQQAKGEELLKQLVGEWQVGIAMKTTRDKAVAGCGEMTAVETDAGINSEINTNIEGYEDYYENDLWSYDPVKGQTHLFMFNSEGERIDYVGNWIDQTTLELEWHGTFEDQEQQKIIRAKWVTKDQFEVHETNYQLGKPILETNYIFKRKETTD